MRRSRDQAFVSSVSFLSLWRIHPSIQQTFLSTCAWHCLATRGAKVTQTDKVPALMELLFSFGEAETR